LAVAGDLDDGCIDDGVFHVRFIRAGFQKPDENVGFDPITASPEDRVPLAEQGWKVTPRAACPNDPQHRLNEQPTVASASPGIRGLSQAMRLHLRPLGVAQYESLHPEQQDDEGSRAGAVKFSHGGYGSLKQIAFGLTRPIVAALGERGDAVNDRVYKVYKVRFDGTAICSKAPKGL
jgi:hypothetical protein